MLTHPPPPIARTAARSFKRPRTSTSPTASRNRTTHTTAPRTAETTTTLQNLLLPSFAPRNGAAGLPQRRQFATPTTMPPVKNGSTVTRAPDITEAVGGKANVEKLHRTSRDFRSDTFTLPTDGQIMAAMLATRGDDVYHEDPSTAALEERIAKMAGKEAALFGASGTMTNQLAIRTHMKQPPHSVITDHRAHVHMMEAGGIAMFTQATTHGIVPSNGVHLTVEDLKPALQLGTNVHIAPTKLICLENTLSGIIFPQDEVVRISELAKEHGIAMHLDGARAWNVAAAEIERRGLDANSEADRTTVLSDILAPFDSASLCLSKGIGAPIGSAIVGSKEFIERARWFRKAFGGGWRQAGLMAGMADYALTNFFPRLADTHALARRLAAGLEDAGCVLLAPVDTSMVFFQPPNGLTIDEIAQGLASLPDPVTLNANRCVIHHQTDPQAVEDFIDTVKRLADAVPEDLRPPAVAEKLGAKDGKFRVNTLGY